MIKLTYMQEQERLAMIGDRNAVMEVVSALRKYRALVSTITAVVGSDTETHILTEVENIEENNS